MIRLGINVDHVATVRNARGESYPSPVSLAALAELGGADNITCHLREDRRHILDRDVELLKQNINVPLNFEMAVTEEMVSVACSLQPHAVTLVPEKRQELTTEGGLDVDLDRPLLVKSIRKLLDQGALVSLFVDHDEKNIYEASDLGAQAVEIHTGDLCHQMRRARTSIEQWALLKPYCRAAELAYDKGMQVHFGHGLNYFNAHWLQVVPYCEEANIGHAVVARALSVGMVAAVKEMKNLLNNEGLKPKVLDNG